MSQLHLFNPENDIALASGARNFTPPKAAVELRMSGAALPLWYANPGDSLLTYGVNNDWLEKIEKDFSPKVDLYDHSTSAGLEASPWGWSAATKHTFECEGFNKKQLPSDDAIATHRMLSHRRTAALLRDDIANGLGFEIAPAATEIDNIEQLKTFLSVNPASILKSPWSSSGRGLIDTRQMSAVETLRRAEGVIRRQGSIMAEVAYTRIADFALLFHCKNGKCHFTGYSFFKTDNSGNYIGNIMATDSRLLDMIGAFYPSERIAHTGEALRVAIERLIAPSYSGPLGIDMLVARQPDDSALLDATVEINLRMTMGIVAHRLTEKYLAEGSEGLYTVVRQEKDSVSDDMIIEDRKMVSGRINLTPPGGLFRFVADVHTL